MLYRFQTTTIKEKKKAYLDTENGTAVVETSSKAAMEAADGSDMTQIKKDKGRRREHVTFVLLTLTN